MQEVQEAKARVYDRGVRRRDFQPGDSVGVDTNISVYIFSLMEQALQNP